MNVNESMGMKSTTDVSDRKRLSIRPDWFFQPVSMPGRCTLLAIPLLFVLWLPALIAGFPGYFSYDAGFGYLMQWQQITDGVLNAHHPILHTLFLKYTISFGQFIFGSFNAGVLVSVAIQALIVSIILSASIKQLLDLKVPRIYCLVMVIYLGLNPLIQLFAFCTTKDVMFSSFVVLYTVLVFSASKTRVLPNQTTAVLILLVFFITVLRANAAIAFLLSVPIQYLLMPEGIRNRFCGAMAVAFVCAACFLGPVQNALDVEPSPIGKWNALCVPEQQIARTSVSSAVSKQDKDEIKVLFPNLEYKESLSDVARAGISASGILTSEFLKIWIKFGLRYPKQYLSAFIHQTEAAWNPLSVIRVYTDDVNKTDVFAFHAQEPCVQHSLSKTLYGYYTFISEDARAPKVPLFGLLLGLPLYLICILVALVKSVVSHNKAAIASLVPIAWLVVSILFGPCMLFRYFLYAVFGLPFFIWMAFGESFSDIKRQ